MTVRTSSIGSMALARSGEVQPQQVDLLAQPAPDLRLLAAPRAGCRRASVSRSLIRRSAVATARRRASVGCAVSTGCTRSRPSRSSRCSAPCSWRNSRDRRGQRLADRRGTGVPLPQRPDPVQFLGQVGQVEVDGERPGDQLGPVQRPAGHQRGDLVPGRIGVRAGPCAGPSGRLAGGLPRRASITARRSRSMSSSRSWPPASRSTSPSRSPSSRTSRRSGSGICCRSASRLTGRRWSRCTAVPCAGRWHRWPAAGRRP